MVFKSPESKKKLHPLMYVQGKCNIHIRNDIKWTIILYILGYNSTLFQTNDFSYNRTLIYSNLDNILYTRKL